MAKRLLLVSAFAAFVAGGVFAQMPQMSVGAGYIQSRGSLGEINYDNAFGITDLTLNQMGMANQNGGFLFFDATYAELAIGLMQTLIGDKYVSDTDVFTFNKLDDTETTYVYGNTGLAMDISLLGRYPVAVGKITVSPLLGVGYNLMLSQKDRAGKKEEFKNPVTDEKAKWDNGDEKEAGDWSTFRIQLGVGADFDVTDHIYIRTQGLAHYRFAAKAYGKTANTLDEDKIVNDESRSFKGGFGGSFTIAVGYKF
jgi:opacity protein-like surface antigen